MLDESAREIESFQQMSTTRRLRILYLTRALNPPQDASAYSPARRVCRPRRFQHVPKEE